MSSTPPRVTNFCQKNQILRYFSDKGVENERP